MAFDFPTSPTVGQQYTPVAGTTYTYNGVGWTLAQSSVATTVNIKTFTASGTYVPSSGLTSAIIECVGGGGGGGGAAVTSTGFTCGGGGGAGSKSIKRATAAEIGSSQTVTIGTGGAGGAAGQNNGNPGGDTSFGTLCIGKGGGPGTGAPANTGVMGGAGGVVGTGDVTGTGAPGETSIGAGIQTVGAYVGAGGSTDLGGGGRAPVQGAGLNGTGYGSGGSGGNTFGAAVAGGNGSPGVVIITEFIAVSAVAAPTPAMLVPLNINSAMMVSQEFGAANTTAVNGGYSVDGFKTEFAGTGVYNFLQTGPTTFVQSPGGSANRLIFGISTAQASMGAGDFAMLSSYIEGLDAARLMWGTSNARSIVIRLGILPLVAGTFSVSIRNNAGNRSYVRTFTISAGEVGTDVVRYLTIPGDTTGTWLHTTGMGISVHVCFAVGSVLSTAPGAWTAGNFIGATGQTNGVSSTGNWHLFDFAVYDATGFATDTGPPFVVPDYPTELLRCQRYFQPHAPIHSLITAAAAGEYTGGTAYLSPSMRIAPTLTATPGGLSNAGSLTLDHVTANGFRFYAQATGVPVVAIDTDVKCDARF